MAFISIVIPVYKTEMYIEELYLRAKKTLETISSDFEIIFVNDGSPDNSWTVISRLASIDGRVKGINLSRNFGQHYAISAGLEYCSGEWVVVMDCDLQDKPEEIINFYNKANSGFEVVLGKRKNRKDNYLKKILGILYYKIFSYLISSKIDPSVGTYRILSRKVVDSFNLMPERLRFFGAMINWLGYNIAYIDIEHSERSEGYSSYNFNRMLRMGIKGMLSFSDKPLKIMVKTGVVLTFISLCYIFYVIARNLIYGTTVVGWTSIIASIFFSTGLIISVLGVVGLYIGSIFDEVKRRPIYLIRDKINF